jgi:hypothetical protein
MLVTFGAEKAKPYSNSTSNPPRKSSWLMKTINGAAEVLW